MRKRTGHPASPSGIRMIKKASGGIRRTGNAQNAALGVLGGSFNPITQAHILLAEKACDTFSLQEALFVLPEVLPHKPALEASLADRLAMMELALAGHDRFSIALSRYGLFLDLCKALRKVYPPGIRIYFITGRDAAERILTWNYPEPASALSDMFSCFEIIAANRGGPFQPPNTLLLGPYADKIHPLDLPAELDALSSTVIRTRIKEGLSIAGLLPDSVRRFIEEKELYRN